MGNMAAETAARMREDGIDPSSQIVPGAPDDGRFGEGTPGGEPAVAPGNEGGVPATPPAATPSAGTQNAETSAVGEPGPIPYARFKEVNDRYSSLRGYEELQELGYDPDSLGRLAAFEAQYIRDPKTTVATLVDGLEDLPPESKAAIAQYLGVQLDDGVPSGPGAPSEDDGQQSSLSPEDQEVLKWARERRASEQQEAESQANNERLDVVVNAWKAKDGEDQIPSPPDHRLLAFVSAAAARGGYKTLNELAESARADWLDERDRVLKEAYQGSRRDGMPPPALPGGTASAAPPQRAHSLKDASKLAKAAMERGELPPVVGG